MKMYDNPQTDVLLLESSVAVMQDFSGGGSGPKGIGTDITDENKESFKFL